MNRIIAIKLKKLRKKNSLTQEEVADTLNITQSTYSRMELGKTHSWIYYIEPISKLYKIKIEELFKNDTIVVNSNNNSKNLLSEQLIAQYELRLHEKDVITKDLKKLLKL